MDLNVRLLLVDRFVERQYFAFDKPIFVIYLMTTQSSRMLSDNSQSKNKRPRSRSELNESSKKREIILPSNETSEMTDGDSFTHLGKPSYELKDENIPPKKSSIGDFMSWSFQTCHLNESESSYPSESSDATAELETMDSMEVDSIPFESQSALTSCVSTDPTEKAMSQHLSETGSHFHSNFSTLDFTASDPEMQSTNMTDEGYFDPKRSLKHHDIDSGKSCFFDYIEDDTPLSVAFRFSLFR